MSTSGPSGPLVLFGLINNYSVGNLEFWLARVYLVQGNILHGYPARLPWQAILPSGVIAISNITL